ncbi:MAG TPA: hypothetical protein VJ875_18510 [Pyrinomonadaceae bacterium]|nr:hypothetical protein [Pyrinomonadaceae bacterium]
MITNELIKDSSDLIPTERTIVWAGLGERWWQDDPEQARSWMLKAIDVVEAVPNKENADEREQRLSAVRAILKIVAPLDQKGTARLIAILSKDAEEQAKGKNAANTDGLIEAAMLLVEKEPRHAKELGSLALRLGPSSQITRLIAKLRSKDPNLGDSLFAETLAAVRQSLDRELLNSLAYLAFPASMKSAASTGELPEDLRTELLKLDLIYLQSNPINAENRDFNCISVASFIAPVLDQFERLLPQQAAVVRQSINQCQSVSPLMGQSLDDSVRRQPLNTVEDLLKAADEAKDLKVSTVYQYRAAALAKEHNDFEAALKILDGMSVEARKFMGGSWEAYRSDWAITAALNYFNSGDIYGMRRIIDAIPDDLRVLAKIGFVRRLPDKRNAETDPTIEFLNDILQSLQKSALSDSDKSIAYFGLLPVVIKFQPTAASAVLKEGVAALNRIERANTQNTNETQGDNFFEGQFSKNLPAALFEMDESVVNEAVSSINSRRARVQIRFELLTVCLERLRSAKLPIAKQVTSPALITNHCITNLTGWQILMA